MPIDVLGVSRNDLAVLFAELGFTKGAEIGVEQGEYSEILLKANPNLILNCVDAWQTYKEYRDHTRQDKLNKFFDITKKRLLPYSDRVNIHKGFSMDIVKQIPDGVLDFVYIDANHEFWSVASDVHMWSRKVRKGGIISGHDYYQDNRYKHVHVKQVIDGYTQAYDIRPWFLFGDSWVIVKQ